MFVIGFNDFLKELKQHYCFAARGLVSCTPTGQARPRDSVPCRPRTRPAALGDHSSNVYVTAAAAERTDGQSDTRAAW